MVKRQFVIDTFEEQIPVEGHEHRNVAVKYLMKRRRSLLMTRDKGKVEELFQKVPTKIRIVGKHVTKTYDVKWEREGTEEFQGARFVFSLTEVPSAPAI